MTHHRRPAHMPLPLPRPAPTTPPPPPRPPHPAPPPAAAPRAAIAPIAALPPDQAEAVLLRAGVGLDAATAAQALGKRPGAVRTAAHRGLRTLARHLDHAGHRALP